MTNDTTMEAASEEMPRYRCHKEVCALKIGALEFRADGSAMISTAKQTVPLFYGTKPGWKDRWHGGEDDLGYFVRYDDGYESWSPTKAFEDGYTRIT